MIHPPSSSLRRFVQIAMFAVGVVVVSLANRNSAAQIIDFDKDVRPILSDNCFLCHGPDANAREADLRLDLREGLLATNDDAVVIPHNSTDSELFRRITSDDPDERMPPPDSGKSLTKQQIETIRQWIDQGAPWELHWAFNKPERPPVPRLDDPSIRNDVDRFILQKLIDKQLTPSPEADRITLIRRLSFDLLGLPPNPEEVDRFVHDDSPNAYEELVERLLSSPHYGERMAMYWLDVVRYADSNGYHSDEPREISPYRDYVIKAFNDNKPYDLFVTEQLAGDLMPNATMEQKVASGFNMLLQTTNEGGAQAKEYLAKYSADRVRNTASIFLGVTLGCAECHDHKFDPFTMRDFYSFAAFFADIAEKGVGNPPAYPVVDDKARQQIASFDEQIRRLQKQLEVRTQALQQEQADWEESIRQSQANQPEMTAWKLYGPVEQSFEDAFSNHPFDPTVVSNPAAEPEIDDQRWTLSPALKDGQTHPFTGENRSWYLARQIQMVTAESVTASLGSDDGIIVWLNGEKVFEKRVRRGVAANQDRVQLKLKPGTNRLLMKVINDGGQAGFYFSLQNSSFDPALLAALSKPNEQRTPEQRQMVSAKFQEAVPELQRLVKTIQEIEKQKNDYRKQLPKSLMTTTTKPRPIRILARGNWQDDSGAIVEPRTPEFLGQFAGLKVDPNRRLTRLDLANWIVHEDNPLTARTFVNRLWKLFFGQGLATPLDDLGAQGVHPSHPELLDYLATEFIRSNWDVQHMVRLMVTSATYRQRSTVSAAGRRIDPYNRYYGRQARFRLDAEMIRDNALAISGLLVRKIGGPSVKPYQPAGYWRHMNFPVRRWVHDKGEDLYRRGLYTWWQRMFLHPSLLAFDAPSREECTVDRPRANTPQQALVLLNDPTFVEAARALAENALRKAGDAPDDQIAWMFRQAVSRKPTQDELHIVRRVRDKHLEQFQTNRESTQEFLHVGERPVPADLPPAELAATASAARIILNLHETILRP